MAHQHSFQGTQKVLAGLAFMTMAALAVLLPQPATQAHPSTAPRVAQKTCAPCRQSLEEYGKAVYVTHENQRVYVCCPGCAAKMQLDWKGYVDILMAMGEKLETVPAAERTPQEPDAQPQITNLTGRRVCTPCMGGACEIKSRKPGFQPDLN